MEVVLIFPHQLFKDHPAIIPKSTIILVEHPHFFTEFAYHKKKLILHRASMQAYAAFLKQKKHTVHYIELKDAKNWHTQLKKLKTSIVHCADVINHALQKEINAATKKIKASIEWYETPMFVSDSEFLEKQFKGKKRFMMRSFYQAQRKRMNILVKNGKPVGGKWSFDEENRKPLNEKITVPKLYKPKANKYTTEAKTYVLKKFKNNPGSANDFWYPITFKTAEKWFEKFLKNRLKHFGTYQDAMHTEHDYLFHSLLTPMLNIGLLTPQHVVEKTVAHAKKTKIPLNSLEGFLRQIIGWREFARGVYQFAGIKQQKSNFFTYRKKLPESFWTGTSGIDPVDHVIQKTLQTGYAHHIERLMVLGNFMMLCGFKPDSVYQWFMELFIDAYDWVMVPNVYGMSQYADGGLMTTKPYCSSSNYILKMSNYKKGDWCIIWTALYWNFMYKNKKLIAKNPRLSAMNMYLKRMKPATLKEHIKNARTFLRKLT